MTPPRLRLLLFPFSFFLLLPFLLSAAPPSPPDELVRRGNAAFQAGNATAAGQLYAAAAEHTADPGLVAFNTAAVLFEQGEYRDAELHYVRALDDRAAPAERRAKALYNRGVCIVKRATDVPALRIAVACFEQALDAEALPEEWRADARFNLELAKLLWAEARARQETRATPNDPPAEDPPEAKPPAGEEDAGPGGESGRSPQAGSPHALANGRPGGSMPQPVDRSAPGSGTLPVLADGPRPQKLSPEDARAHLARAAERLERDRRANARLLAGPERPNVRDW